MGTLDSLWQALQPWVVLLLLAAIAVLVGAIFDKVILAFLRRLAERTRTELDDLVLRAVHPAIGIFITIAAFQAGLDRLGGSVPGRIVGAWRQLNVAVGVLVVAVMVARLAAGLLRYGARKEPRFFSAARVGARVLNVAVYVVAFLVVLDTYGISITPLVTSLGIAGLAVALALQDTLSNFFAGVWIQTGQSMLPGHFVRLEVERLEGTVVEVGWRTTKIRSLANNSIVVPNAKLAQAIVTDYDMPEPRVGTGVQVAVAPATEVAPVLRAMEEATREAARYVPAILLDPPPAAELREFAETGLLLAVAFQVRRVTDQGRAQDAVRQRVLERFRRDGVHLAHAVRLSYAAP